MSTDVERSCNAVGREELVYLKEENEALKREIEAMLMAKEIAKEKVRVRIPLIFSHDSWVYALPLSLKKLMLLQPTIVKGAIQELVEENRRLKRKLLSLEVIISSLPGHDLSLPLPPEKNQQPKNRIQWQRWIQSLLKPTLTNLLACSSHLNFLLKARLTNMATERESFVKRLHATSEQDVNALPYTFLVNESTSCPIANTKCQFFFLV